MQVWLPKSVPLDNQSVIIVAGSTRGCILDLVVRTKSLDMTYNISLASYAYGFVRFIILASSSFYSSTIQFINSLTQHIV